MTGDAGTVVVVLPRSLVALFADAPRRIDVDGTTVAEVVDALERRLPGIRDRLLGPGPAIREHMNVFVAGERATLGTPVPAGSTVHVIPAVSGG